MAESELIDQVNENGEVIGQGLRSEFHKDPTKIHPVVHCWLFNSKGEVLLQQRSLQKATSPGKWDMSCGGHILSGDKAEESLERELEEELGLSDIEFNLADKYVLNYPTQSEFIYLYYAIVDIEISKLKLQEIEVERVEWILPETMQQLVIDGKRESTPFLFTQVTKILRNLAFHS